MKTASTNPKTISLSLASRPACSAAGAIRLVVSRDTPGAVQVATREPTHPHLAQAHQWLAQLLSGEVSSLRRIAAAVGKSERYVSKVIRVAFLAPDLVEAVLEGRAFIGLTLAKLTKDLPSDWNEQRRLFAVLLGAKRTFQHADSECHLEPNRDSR